MYANLKLKLQWAMGSITVSRRLGEYLNFRVRIHQLAAKRGKKCFTCFKITIILLFWFGNLKFEETSQSLYRIWGWVHSWPRANVHCKCQARGILVKLYEAANYRSPGARRTFLFYIVHVTAYSRNIPGGHECCMLEKYSFFFTESVVGNWVIIKRQADSRSTIAWSWYSFPVLWASAHLFLSILSLQASPELVWFSTGMS